MREKCNFLLQVYTTATYVHEWQICNLKISHTVGSESIRGPLKSLNSSDRPRTSEVRGPLSGAKSKMAPRPIAKSHRVTYHAPPRCVVGPWISYIRPSRKTRSDPAVCHI